MNSNFKLPRIGSKRLEILKFIGRSSQGRRATDIEKFIVENLRQREWDPVRRSGSWTISLYGFGKEKGLFEKYCTKVGNFWYLTQETATLLKSIDPAIPYFCRPSSSSITTLDPDSVRDLSVGNAELFSRFKMPTGKSVTMRFLPSEIKPIAPIYEPRDLRARSSVELPADTAKAIQALFDSKEEIKNLEAELDKLEAELNKKSQKLAEAKALRANRENDVRKSLGL